MSETIEGARGLQQSDKFLRGIRERSDAQVIPFNTFVREARLTINRLPFHQYVTKLKGSTSDLAREDWWMLLREFDAERDLRDLRQTERDSLI